ncbi:hypothetical protein GIB67_027588, partial [Kingdonia uniflora]
LWRTDQTKCTFGSSYQSPCYSAVDSGDTYESQDANRHRPTVSFTHVTIRASQYLIRIREMMARYEELFPYVDPFWEGFIAGFEERTTIIFQLLILDVNGRRDVGDDIVPPLSGTISGYEKFRERLQDFQKSSTIQILWSKSSEDGRFDVARAYLYFSLCFYLLYWSCSRV